MKRFATTLGAVVALMLLSGCVADGAYYGGGYGYDGGYGYGYGQSYGRAYGGNYRNYDYYRGGREGYRSDRDRYYGRRYDYRR